MGKVCLVFGLPGCKCLYTSHMDPSWGKKQVPLESKHAIWGLVDGVNSSSLYLEHTPECNMEKNTEMQEP